MADVGLFEAEDALIDALVELNRASQVACGDTVVHVYETDATPLGIGRRYLGAIDAGAVLMMGEVDKDRMPERGEGPRRGVSPTGTRALAPSAHRWATCDP